MTFATLVTCHCLNNSAVTSMWGSLDMVEPIIIIAAVSWHHYCAAEVFTGFDAIWIFVSAQLSIFFAVSIWWPWLRQFIDFDSNLSLFCFCLQNFTLLGKVTNVSLIFALIMMIDDDHDDNTIDDNGNLPWWFCCPACSCQSLSQPLFLGTSRIDVVGSYLNLKRLSGSQTWISIYSKEMTIQGFWQWCWSRIQVWLAVRLWTQKAFAMRRGEYCK